VCSLKYEINFLDEHCASNGYNFNSSSMPSFLVQCFHLFFFSFRLLNIILAAVILNLHLTFIARVSLSFGVIIYVMFSESL
jgi:hypothetical protein